MTKLEQISQAAAALNEEQLDGLLAYVEYLGGEPYFDTLPAEAKASIERGMAERDAGLGRDASDVFAKLQDRIDRAKT